MKLLKYVKKNIISVVIILAIVIIGIIQYMNIDEGLVYVDGTYNTDTQKVVIGPQPGKDGEDLLIAELVLFGADGKIDYDASVSGDIDNDSNGYDKLKDSDKDTSFRSKDRNATLTITPKIQSAKITKIVIRNNKDVPHRLKTYKLSIERNNGSVFYIKNLDELSNLFTSPYLEEIIIS
jgi:hypothetical protein